MGTANERVAIVTGASSGIGAATVIAASLVGSEQGFLWFSGVAAVGAIVAYGTHQFLTRQARAPLERHGIDVERLMVK